MIIERAWKNHKWVDRKRGPNGEWIYDYGNGYSNSKTARIKKTNQTNNLSTKHYETQAKLKNTSNDVRKQNGSNTSMARLKVSNNTQEQNSSNTSKARLKVSSIPRKTIASGQEWIARAILRRNT